MRGRLASGSSVVRPFMCCPLPQSTLWRSRHSRAVRTRPEATCSTPQKHHHRRIRAGVVYLSPRTPSCRSWRPQQERHAIPPPSSDRWADPEESHATRSRDSGDTADGSVRRARSLLLSTRSLSRGRFLERRLVEVWSRQVSRATKIVLVVLAVLAVGALFAFGPAFALKSAARQAIARYDSALIVASRSLNSNDLGDTATVNQKQREFAYLQLFRRTRLQSELLGLNVLSVARQGASVDAHVTERWRYTEVDATTGKPTAAPYEETRTLDYVLVQSGGRWIVDAVRLSDK